MFSSSGPRLTLEAYPAVGLIREAYNLESYQVSFAASVSQPKGNYYDIMYYDIVARAGGAPTRGEFRQMLRTLLAERFNLKVHRESKEMPVYAMVVGKNGPKFKESPPDVVFRGNHGVNGRNQTITLSKATMELVAREMRSSFGVDRPVLDRTGSTEPTTSRWRRAKSASLLLFRNS